MVVVHLFSSSWFIEALILGVLTLNGVSYPVSSDKVVFVAMIPFQSPQFRDP